MRRAIYVRLSEVRPAPLRLSPAVTFTTVMCFHIYSCCPSTVILQLLLLLLPLGLSPLNLKCLFPACSVARANSRFPTDSLAHVVEGPLHGFFHRFIKQER